MPRFRITSPNRVVLLTVGMVALAGIVVSAAAYVHARRLSSDYNSALEESVRQKGLAYGQTTQSLLTIFRETSPESFAVLVEEVADNPEGVVSSFSADERGQAQDDLLALGIWIGGPDGDTRYDPVLWQDLAAKETSADNPEVQALLAETIESREPGTRIDRTNQGLIYSIALEVTPQTSTIVIVTLDVSQEFAFIASQQASSTRTTILFAVGSILFVGLVAGALSLALSRSLTSRKLAEDEMRASEERYRTLAELAPVGVFRTDAAGRTLYGNDMAQALIAIEAGPLDGPLWTRAVHPDEQERVREDWQQARLRDAPYETECRLAPVDGRDIWVQVLLTPERDWNGRLVGYVGTVANVTDRVEMEADLREQARHDRLTGLLNHAAAIDDLEGLVASRDCGRLVVAMIDVDGMKAMNDTYGHPVGDQALQAAARALSRDGAIVGRYGGDEFIVILPAADRAAAEAYRRDVADELAHLVLRDDGTGSHVPLAISMGFSYYPDEAEAPADLVRLADTAMYAERRERYLGRSAAAGDRPATVEERAAEMIGEIVPLLTSPGNASSKLHSVAHRLLVGLGYDGVTIVLFSPQPGGGAVSTTVAKVEEQLIHAWDEDQGRQGDTSALRDLLEKVQRPFIIDDLASDERLSPGQRKLLSEARLRSGLIVPMLRQGQTLGALAVGSRNEAAFGPEDARLLSAVSGQVTAIVQIASLVEELQKTSEELREARGEAVILLAASAEAHDATTGRHLHSVRHLARDLALELGHDDAGAEAIGLAAVLHDIGKVRVPDLILRNPNDLSLQQWETMKRHTVWGAEFLAGHAGFELAATVARCHHERWDGTGYPEGLAGDAIPEAAAIVSVADSFDAITHDRPYRAARPVDWAVGEIASHGGSQFSPRVVDALLRLHARHALDAYTDLQAA